MASSIDASTSGAGGVITTADNTGILQLKTAGTTAVTVDASQNVGIGTTSPAGKLETKGTGAVQQWLTTSSTAQYDGAYFNLTTSGASTNYGQTSFQHILNTGAGDLTDTYFSIQQRTTAGAYVGNIYQYSYKNQTSAFFTNNTERMRIDSSGIVFVGKSVTTFSTAGTYISPSGEIVSTRNADSVISVNRTTNDGTLVAFFQDGTLEGTISVSGSTVSYNGGHLSRWSQWQNETGQPNVYRGTVLESVDAMCEWEKDGEPLPNEQATKTIVSTTVASKTVAGVFDRYDEDDKTNPYDFFVAQSGDFVIRIAQGVTVQNGDLLESAGDGTAKPQADDICRSSTIAKVTSNYVSATYEDGSYCVPCILMIG